MIFGEGPIIKNIAGDLNKLFLQGTRAGQPINNVEGDAAADQGTIQLMADRDPVIRDISTGLGWAGREVTVSGTGALQLVNSLGRPLRSWSAELAPYQDLNGYDSPWPAGSGKNKANLTWGDYVPSINTGYDTRYSGWSTDYIPVNPQNDYVVSINGVSTGRYVFFYTDDSFLGYSNYSSSILLSTYENWQQTTRIRLRVDGTSANNPMCQLENGSTATEWSPYENICPILGTDKLNMFVEEYYDQSATPKAVITLPTTIYNGSVSDDGAVSNWGEVDLGTINNWARTTTAGISYYYCTFSSVAKGTDNIMCEQLKAMASSTDVAFVTYGEDCIINTYINSNGLRVRYDSVSTVADLITALQGVKLVYELANSVQFPLTTPDIPTPTGNATTWATAEDGIVTNFSATYLQAE